MMEIMKNFGDATELRINVAKSSECPIKCSAVNLDEVLQNFEGARTQLLVTYLGLPITLNRVKMN
jgi:hypothetical protein